MRTPCELLYQLRKKLKVVAHGVAEVPVQGGTIYGIAILEGYARVMVDRVENGWEDLDLEIPGGDGEEELGQALHTWTCWKKQYIRIAGRDPSPSPRSPPAGQGSPRPRVDPPSPPAAQDPALVHRRHRPLPGSLVLVRLRHLLAPQRRRNQLGCRHRHLQDIRRPKNKRRKRSPRQRSQVMK